MEREGKEVGSHSLVFLVWEDAEKPLELPEITKYPLYFKYKIYLKSNIFNLDQIYRKYINIYNINRYVIKNISLINLMTVIFSQILPKLLTIDLKQSQNELFVDNGSICCEFFLTLGPTSGALAFRYGRTCLVSHCNCILSPNLRHRFTMPYL